MLTNIAIALAVSLIVTGFMVFIIRPAWHAWDQPN
jgi:hypothetical protein